MSELMVEVRARIANRGFVSHDDIGVLGAEILRLEQEVELVLEAWKADVDRLTLAADQERAARYQAERARTQVEEALEGPSAATMWDERTGTEFDD